MPDNPVDGEVPYAIDGGDVGKMLTSTKQLAATRQIQAAIFHFRHDDFECAITLAGAAEGLIPTPERPHMFSVMKASPSFKEAHFNALINWLKHPAGDDQTLIPEFEAAMIIVRAISKLIAKYGDGQDDMREFVRWTVAAGYLSLPDDDAAES